MSQNLFDIFWTRLKFFKKQSQLPCQQVKIMLKLKKSSRSNLEYLCWRAIKSSLSDSELREKNHKKGLYIPYVPRWLFIFPQPHHELHAPHPPSGSLCKGSEYGTTRTRTWKLGGTIEVIEKKSLIFTESWGLKVWLLQGPTATESRASPVLGNTTPSGLLLLSSPQPHLLASLGLSGAGEGLERADCGRGRMWSTFPENGPSPTESTWGTSGAWREEVFRLVSEGTQDLW